MTRTIAADGAVISTGARARGRIGRDLRPFVALAVIEILVLLLCHGSSYYTSVCLEWTAFALLAQGFNVVAGYAGRLAFGNIIFFGLSAYAVVGGAANHWYPEIVGLAIAVVGCCVVAYVLSLIFWRVDGLLFALATFALAAMLEQLITVSHTFGESSGMQEPLALTNSIVHLAFLNQFNYLIVGAMLVLLAAAVTLRFSRSTVGREAQATREDRIAAATGGIDARRVTALAWMLSAGISAVAGVFYAQYTLYIEPTSAFGLSGITLIVVPAILGGMGTVWGPVIGSVIVPLGLLLDRMSGGHSVTSLNLLVYGAVLIVVLRVYPGGLSAGLASLRGRLGRSHDAAVVGRPRLSQPHPATAPGKSSVRKAAPTEQDRGPLLEVRDVRRSFGGVRALQGISFSVAAGEIMGLLGPNGAGKSTLFNCIAGVERPDAGTVVFGGQDISRARPHDRARAGIARTYQTVRLFQGLTALENVSVGGLRSFGPEEAEARAEAMLSMVGLSAPPDQLAGALSLVDQRRVELARAMVTDARLVMLDEVMTGLNEEEAEAMRSVVRRLNDEHGTSFVIVEHVMGHILPLISRVVVMEKGRLLADGAPSEILTREDVMEAYFGRKVSGGVLDA